MVRSDVAKALGLGALSARSGNIVSPREAPSRLLIWREAQGVGVDGASDIAAK